MLVNLAKNKTYITTKEVYDIERKTQVNMEWLELHQDGYGTWLSQYAESSAAIMTQSLVVVLATGIVFIFTNL